jgi:YHS domain-containing protein
MTVQPKSAAASSQFRSQTFYFCSAHCRQEFDANPSSFVDREPAPAPAAGGCGCSSARPPAEPQDHGHGHEHEHERPRR